MAGVEFEGLVGTIALALPVLALVTVMVLAIRQVGRRRSSRKDVALTGRYGEAVTPAPDVGSLRRGAEPLPSDSGRVSGTSGTQTAPAAAALTAGEIADRIRVAESRGTERDLAELYLALARHHVASARTSEARDLLLKSIRLAAHLGQKEAHAGARLELGDLCREQGDLTTACEHWQIARQLFFETQCAAPLAQAETRMRQNHCPTDWVLNDF